MKKMLHRLTGLFILFLPLVFGGMMVYGNGFKTDHRDAVWAFFEEAPVIGVILGVVFILIGVVYLFTFGSARSRDKYLTFPSENGEVSISVTAVREFIRKLGDEFGAVISMDPAVRTEKEMISVDLDVKIQTGTRIPELSQLLQDRIRESIRDGLGIVEVREIKVRIKELVGAPPTAKV